MKSTLALMSTTLHPSLFLLAVVWGLARFRHQTSARFWPTYGRGVVLVAVFLAARVPNEWIALTSVYPAAGNALLVGVAVAVVVLGVSLPALVGLWGQEKLICPTVLRGTPDWAGLRWGVLWAVVSSAFAFVLYFAVEGIPVIDPDAVSTGPRLFTWFWWADRAGDWVWGPFQEEFMSRGLFLGAVVHLARGRSGVLWAGVVFVSFLWACGHTGQWDAWPVRVLWLTLEGCVYSWLVLRHDLEASILAHMVSNVLATTVPFVVLPWLM